MKNKSFKPSDFMKARRPEQFSDSSIISEPIISKEQFDHFLATITQRCQEKDFENFCRLLAQKEICPNLVIQTGSTGGGDSKVDTETYPVADDISLKWYEGIGRKADNERWAFAISVQKTWKTKIQGDVKKIVLTGRDYKRIYFMSNQAIRDKDRAEYEDTLTKEYGVPVHIFDKQWIIDKVYSHNRFDIAISALNLTYAEDRHKVIGFKDAEKLADLAAIEKEIDNFDSAINMGYQFVEDCLYAAILSRELEKPQFEVYGRFERAKRVAEEFGVSQQVLRATYQHIWTAYCWYNDFKLTNKLYDELEALSINSNNVWDLERLCTLYTNIQTAAFSEYLTFSEAKLTERFESLFNTLSAITDDNTRPNASATAKSHILLLKLSKAAITKKPLTGIFSEIGELLDSSHNLMDFPAEILIRVIKELSGFIGEEHGFDELFEKIIEVSTQRLGDGEAGRLLVNNGFRKLDSNKYHEAIKLFAKASNKLIQYEHRDYFIQAQAGIACAYESMGLFWAARGCYALAVHQLDKDFAEHGTMPKIMSTLLRHLIWIEIRLGRVPYVLAWLSYKNIIDTHILEIKPDENSDEDNQLIDTVLGILILKTKYQDLGGLSFLPELLDKFGLYMSQFAALYALGHEDRVVSEFKFEDENLYEFCTNWLNQPANADLPISSEWNIDKIISINSLVLGVKFSIDLPNDKGLLMFSEAILSAIECFLATGLAHKFYPQQSNVNCILEINESVEKVSYKEIENDCGEITIYILVKNNDMLSYIQSKASHDDIFNLVVRIICEGVIIGDLNNTEALVKNDLALDRMNQLIHLPTILNNILDSQLLYSLKQWEAHAGHEQFALLRTKPWSDNLYNSNTTFKIDDSKNNKYSEKSFSEAKHNDIKTISIINTRVWNKAKWSGTLYAFSPETPIPILGLTFNNKTESLKIFNGWKKRLGSVDINNEINVCIITEIDKNNPHHYKVIIHPNYKLLDSKSHEFCIFVNRSNIMTPNNSVNLNNFKRSLSRGLGYFLIPATFNQKNSQPEMADEKYWIRKNNIKIIEAWKIGVNDMEYMAISGDDDLSNN
ncbi:hypothetical protein B0F87_104269 [Methylobacter tundripaludum]|uniref:Tetratricopeptide repeat protein n=1 Tax=Methylobacter tundripaludum TaxID=173365 RepID=A0A2S6HFD4_9GAMM|nr:hypothetical protein [Methylobacter tundripaludum]PPK76177.1 hypothetical protein B0F87_104269 [Methylobacter tundripaludum]